MLQRALIPLHPQPDIRPTRWGALVTLVLLPSKHAEGLNKVKEAKAECFTEG